VVLATDAATNHEVLTDQERFVGGDAAGLLEPIVGPSSLILTPPPAHLRNRKLLLPPFHGTRVAAWTDCIRDLVSERIPALSTGGAVAVRPWAQRLTLEVILRVVFGLEDTQHATAFRAVIDRLLDDRLAPLLIAPAFFRRDFGSRSPGGILRARRAALDDLLGAELRRRRSPDADESKEDVLSTLLEARDEDGNGFNDAQLCDELTGLVLAGHETTATALAWTLHLLAHNRGARDSLVADLDAGQETMLKAVIKESLRMRSPVIDAIRTAAHDTELGGHPVPKHAFVSAMFCVMHVDPELWPDPQAFKPERHLDGNAVPYSLTPFGGGIRRCLGASLAQLELEVALKTVLADYLPEPAGPSEPIRLHGVTLVPARGGQVRLTRRAGKPARTRTAAAVT
jgi:cytochrome P450